MSSYRVSDLQICIIAYHLKTQKMTGYQLPFEGFDQINQRIVEMIEMNEKSVFTRYEGRHNSDNFTFNNQLQSRDDKSKIADKMLSDFFVAGKLKAPTVAQFVKYIDNYLYQCAESEEIIESALYKELKQSADNAARVAIGADYERAEWGMK